jgi:type VI secretion system protein ImpA
MQGEAEQAVSLLMEAASAAQNERNKFLLRMEVSRLCIDINQRELAAHMLRQMLAEAEELHLERWEGRALLGTLLTMLLNAMDGYGAETEERGQLFARLCKIDPVRALAMRNAE